MNNKYAVIFEKLRNSPEIFNFLYLFLNEDRTLQRIIQGLLLAVGSHLESIIINYAKPYKNQGINIRSYGIYTYTS